MRRFNFAAVLLVGLSAIGQPLLAAQRNYDRQMSVAAHELGAPQISSVQLQLNHTMATLTAAHELNTAAVRLIRTAATSFDNAHRMFKLCPDQNVCDVPYSFPEAAMAHMNTTQLENAQKPTKEAGGYTQDGETAGNTSSSSQEPGDLLFQFIAHHLDKSLEQRDRSDTTSWGTVLDAGTGMHSLAWLVAQQKKTAKLVAVTASPSQAEALQQQFKDKLRPQDEILTGDWADSTFLSNFQADVIAADYLIGAIDGFSPYFQDRIFSRLVQHLKPGGWLYVVGLEPFSNSEPTSKATELLQQVARVRDACILLAGHRCYREYPQEWVHRQLEQVKCRMDASERWPNVYSARQVERQIQVGRDKLPFFPDTQLADEMAKYLDQLSQETRKPCSNDQTHSFGFDYVVCAEHQPESSS
ncbi:unnamed protein product [Vitrella brassicaformis CCMP3155]|uniref:Methyltransferase domain-containing protein n=1 Tax=Vitrella brassicaformis (strain CCMP3155) TaxID=1169540 RepID=A0A0G4GFI8_VITBC|nr:unnamed protein product [Vitrella brassicaformis CCMP3155]|eukprot:CEM28277.1 unnamed protein product [Vitrella brassicaformis CCMP3155]